MFIDVFMFLKEFWGTLNCDFLKGMLREEIEVGVGGVLLPPVFAL